MAHHSARSGHAQTPAGTRGEPPPEPADLPPPQALSDALRRLGELREYVAYYLWARFDRFKLSLRRAGILAIIGIVALLGACAVVVTAAVLLCVGLAQALAVALGGRAWAGNLIVGLAILALIGAGAWIGWMWISASLRRKTVKRYELRQKRQRADFGHDVREQADQSH